MFDSGITPNQIAELTPHQAFAVLYEPRKESAASSPLESLYLINLRREAKGQQPSIPHWWGSTLPRRQPRGQS